LSETGTDLGIYQEVDKPAEKAHARKILDRRAHRAGPGKIELVEQDTGRAAIQMAGKTASLAQLKALASSGLHSADALFMLVKQLTNLEADAIGEDNDGPANEALAMLDELEPDGGAQAMLATQMVAVHVATMSSFTKALLKDQTFAGRELYFKQAAKLAAVFTRQNDSYAKLKRNGTQTVNVKHIHVNEGGQAVVGNVG
jgi:hypothetical protein